VLLVVFLNSPKVLAIGDDHFQQKLEPPSLVSLVRGYVEGASEQSGEELLETILNHPGANVQAVETAIRAIPHYGKSPPWRSASSFRAGEREEDVLYVVCSSFL
jgi:hypothetical protein